MVVDAVSEDLIEVILAAPIQVQHQKDEVTFTVQEHLHMEQKIPSELRSFTTKHTSILYDDIITEQINEKINTANVHSTTETEKTKKNIIKHLEYTKKCTADKISEKAKALQEPAPQKRIKTPDRKDEHKPSEKANKNKKSQEDLNPAQSKYPVSFRGRMRPDPSIQHHPAYPLLFKYTTKGCPVDCGQPWSREHLEAAVSRGPHTSATSPEAARALRTEALEKVAQGEAEVLRWDDIKDAPPLNLKISPLAAVPHKSRLF